MGGRLLAMQEAVFCVGMIVPKGWCRALMQCLSECGVSLHGCDVIVAGLEDLNGTANIGCERDRVVLLIAKPRVFDRWIGGGTRLYSSLLCRRNQRISAAETETEHPNRGQRQVVFHVVDPFFHIGLHSAVA